MSDLRLGVCYYPEHWPESIWQSDAQRMRELGIKPHMSLDHGITTSFYYVDPDGNSVELLFPCRWPSQQHRGPTAHLSAPQTQLSNPAVSLFNDS